MNCLSGSHEDCARKILYLIFKPQNWINRRVDSVYFPDFKSIARRVSVDTSIPEEGLAPYLDGMLTLPIARIQKGDMDNFSTQDEQNRTWSLCAWRKTRDIEICLLSEWARACRVESYIPHGEAAGKSWFSRIIDATPRDASAEQGEESEPTMGSVLSEYTESSDQSKAFLVLAKMLARDRIIFAQLDPSVEHQCRRKVLKFSYERPVRLTRMEFSDLIAQAEVNNDCSPQPRQKNYPVKAAGHDGVKNNVKRKDGDIESESAEEKAKRVEMKDERVERESESEEKKAKQAKRQAKRAERQAKRAERQAKRAEMKAKMRKWWGRQWKPDYTRMVITASNAADALHYHLDFTAPSDVAISCAALYDESTATIISAVKSEDSTRCDLYHEERAVGEGVRARAFLCFTPIRRLWMAAAGGASAVVSAALFIVGGFWWTESALPETGPGGGSDSVLALLIAFAGLLFTVVMQPEENNFSRELLWGVRKIALYSTGAAGISIALGVVLAVQRGLHIPAGVILILGGIFCGVMSSFQWRKWGISSPLEPSSRLRIRNVSRLRDLCDGKSEVYYQPYRPLAGDLKWYEHGDLVNPRIRSEINTAIDRLTESSNGT